RNPTNLKALSQKIRCLCAGFCAGWLQVVGLKVCVALRHLRPLVPEDSLDAVEVQLAALDRPRGEGMPQIMEPKVFDSGLSRDGREPGGHRIDPVSLPLPMPENQPRGDVPGLCRDLCRP